MQHVESHANATLANVTSAKVAPSALAPASPVSAAWLVRRAALWMLFVFLGITGSCLLYMAVSHAEADSAPSQRATVTTDKL